jgi:hypothetical protein
MEQHTPQPGYMTTLTNTISSKPQMALGVIVVLIIIIIGMYIYYHGILVFGPYAGLRRKSKKSDNDESDDESDDKSDDETDKLIKNINKKSKSSKQN